MNDLYDVLEICLQDIEKGADVETVLFRYPEHAEELRPILETSLQARMLAASDPSADVMHRNRAKVLQQAAQMREAQARPSRRLWSVPLRRAVVSLAVLTVLFVTSTGLVRAASTTLPGDNLYPVKRTWEDVRLLLALDDQVREALEVEHENERLEELNELLAEGRSAKVDFSGVVTAQDGGLWLISEIPVLVSSQTDLRDQPIVIGDAVRVRGLTQADGTVVAERLDLLPAGMPLPTMGDDDESEGEHDQPGNENEAGEENSNDGPGSEGESPEAEETKSSEEKSSSDKSSLDGVVDSISGNILIVNGQPMNISGAEIKGTLKEGAVVKVEGYYSDSGVFIVTKIEFQENDSDSENSNDDGNSNENANENESNNDNNNEDHSDDENSNDDNENDSGGNSGSGGGGGDH